MSTRTSGTSTRQRSRRLHHIQDDFEILRLAGVEMEGSLHESVADRGDIQYVIAGRDVGDPEAACRVL